MRKFASLTIIFLATLLFTAAENPDARFRAVGGKLVCTCGCTQMLLECNHVGCPSSPKMIADVKDSIAGGKSNNSIFELMAAKYGPVALAAPMRGGFDNAAYIVPAVTFLFALLGTAFLIHFWQRRSALSAGTAAVAAPISSDAVRDRIRRETDF